MSPKRQKEWWQDRYGTKKGVEGYLNTYKAILTPEVSRAEIKLVIESLRQEFGYQIKSSTKILDGFCGNGRHAKELLKEGFWNITSFDYSKEMVSRARKNLMRINDKVKILKQDARDLPFKKSCFDLYFVLGNSALGFFDNPKEDFTVLREAYRTLKKGGFFVFDLVDYSYVIEYLKDSICLGFENKILVVRQRHTYRHNGLLRTGHRELRFLDQPIKSTKVTYCSSLPAIYEDPNGYFHLIRPNGCPPEAIWSVYLPKSIDIQDIGRWVYQNSQVVFLLKQAGFSKIKVLDRKFSYAPKTNKFGTMGVRNLYLAQKK